MNVEQIAQVCHDANKSYCETQDDQTQSLFGLAQEWQRQRAIKGVQFALENKTGEPGAQHEAWLKDKLADGWKYGPVKDAEKKEHPCCVPYAELPEAQRRKDKLFIAIVWALA